MNNMNKEKQTTVMIKRKYIIIIIITVITYYISLTIKNNMPFLLTCGLWIIWYLDNILCELKKRK